MTAGLTRKIICFVAACLLAVNGPGAASLTAAAASDSRAGIYWVEDRLGPEAGLYRVHLISDTIRIELFAVVSGAEIKLLLNPRVWEGKLEGSTIRGVFTADDRLIFRNGRQLRGSFVGIFDRQEGRIILNYARQVPVESGLEGVVLGWNEVPERIVLVPRQIAGG